MAIPTSDVARDRMIAEEIAAGQLALEQSMGLVPASGTPLEQSMGIGWTEYGNREYLDALTDRVFADLRGGTLPIAQTPGEALGEIGATVTAPARYVGTALSGAATRLGNAASGALAGFRTAGVLLVVGLVSVAVILVRVK